ncbi:MAG TPA: hypothetical protein VGH20_22405, partial [Myxococcales bacterium]
MNIGSEEVLAALSSARGKGLSLKALQKQLHVPPQPLRKALSSLLASGRAVFDGHDYRAAARKHDSRPPKPAERTLKQPGRKHQHPNEHDDQDDHQHQHPNQNEHQHQHHEDEHPHAHPHARNKPPPKSGRKQPAALVEGVRARREQQEGKPAEPAKRKPGGLVTGVIHLKAEGYGFVTPLVGEGGRENDLFVPPQYVKGALDGDV